MKAILLKIKEMEWEQYFIHKAIDMKEPLKKVKNMELENLLIKKEKL